MREYEPELKKKNRFNVSFFSRYAYIFIIGLCLLLGVSYSLTFFVENKSITTGRIVTGSLTVTYTNTSINATGLSTPLTDKAGMLMYSKNITLNNTTSVDGKVKLILERTSGLNLIDMRYAVIVNGAIQEIADVPSTGEILHTPIMGGEQIDIEIRLWPKPAYAGDDTTFVGNIALDVKYLGEKAASLSDAAGKYVNFNCAGNNCEVWQIVKVENGRLVLTRQADYSGATERVNSNLFNTSLSFNNDNLITSVSTDNKNVYLHRTVKISSGSGTVSDPYNLIGNIPGEPDRKVIATITYNDADGTTAGTQDIYYDEANYISQVLNNPAFVYWYQNQNTYELGDLVNFNSNQTLTAFRQVAAVLVGYDDTLTGFNCTELQCALERLYQYRD